jgi:hypothetical protein
MNDQSPVSPQSDVYCIDQGGLLDTFAAERAVVIGCLECFSVAIEKQILRQMV